MAVGRLSGLVTIRPVRMAIVLSPQLVRRGAAARDLRGPRSFEEFESRLRQHLRRLDASGVNYRPIEGPTPGQSRVWVRESPSARARQLRKLLAWTHRPTSWPMTPVASAATGAWSTGSKLVPMISTSMAI
jgi:hypothetical protein